MIFSETYFRDSSSASSTTMSVLQNTIRRIIQDNAMEDKFYFGPMYSERFYRSITNTWIEVDGEGGVESGLLSFREACDLVADLTGMTFEESMAAYLHLGGIGDIDNEVKHDLAQVGIRLSRDA